MSFHKWLLKRLDLNYFNNLIKTFHQLHKKRKVFKFPFPVSMIGKKDLMLWTKAENVFYTSIISESMQREMYFKFFQFFWNSHEVHEFHILFQNGFQKRFIMYRVHQTFLSLLWRQLCMEYSMRKSHYMNSVTQKCFSGRHNVYRQHSNALKTNQTLKVCPAFSQVVSLLFYETGHNMAAVQNNLCMSYQKRC